MLIMWPVSAMKPFQQIRVWGTVPLSWKRGWEERYLPLVLPYIKTARRGVERLGYFLETAEPMDQTELRFLMNEI